MYCLCPSTSVSSRRVGLRIKFDLFRRGESLDCDQAHLMLYCWAHSSQLPPQRNQEVITYLVKIIHHCTAGAHADKVIPLLNKVFPGATCDQSLIIKTASHYLQHRRTDLTLSEYLVEMLSLIISACPWVVTKDVLPELYSSVVIASYRQLCRDERSAYVNDKLYARYLLLLGSVQFLGAECPAF